MTYPSLVPLKITGQPFTLPVQPHDLAILVFTDKPGLDDFIKKADPEWPPNLDITVFTASSNGELAMFLQRCATITTSNGRPTLVMLDPRYDASNSHCYPISEFVSFLMASSCGSNPSDQ